MKAFSFLMIGLAMVVAPGSAWADQKVNPGDNVLVVTYDKTDLKTKEPYPIFASLVIDKNDKVKLVYGGGAVSEFNHKLTPAESQKFRALRKKYGAFQDLERDGKVRVFQGKGTKAIDDKARDEIYKFGLELTQAILKKNL